MASESLYILEAADWPEIQPEDETNSLLSALEQVATERYHQDLQHGGPGHDDTHSPAEWYGLIRTHAAQMLSSCDQPAPDYPDRLIKIAALAVAARQSWDRQHPARTCRVCGCTDDRACVTDDGPCHWVAPDLCSACAQHSSDCALHNGPALPPGPCTCGTDDTGEG
jgi:hypothetical protein